MKADALAALECRRLRALVDVDLDIRTSCTLRASS